MSRIEEVVEKFTRPSNFNWHTNKLKLIETYANCIFGGKIKTPSIVISGTKGKGSTCSVCESILRASGLRTGLFTSPHLVSPTERIRINGRCISEDQFVSTYNDLISEFRKYKLPILPFFAFQTFMSGFIF